ncbi:MAG: MotA/TolQ/ExbB proton channel family protein [Proteobacteria bacterium]|nr:MotA/TolQ/ExbB proton channel family protein [Pseudomonadota bacterium]
MRGVARAPGARWSTFVVSLVLSLSCAAANAQTRRNVGSSGDRLEQAYKREFAFLEAEKHALAKRIQELRKRAGDKTSLAKAAVEDLHGKVTAASLEVERISELLSSIEREVEGLDEGQEIIDGVLSQAESRLEAAGVPPGNATLPNVDQPNVDRSNVDQDAQAARLARMGSMLNEAGRLLRLYATPRKVTGSFFLPSGDKVDATLLHVGNVATYGTSTRASGALAPAGEGRLKLWPGASADVAESLVAAGHPPLLKIFLYESLDRDVEKKQAKTPLQVVTSGGFVAWVIVCLGGLAALLILWRMLALLRSAAPGDRLVRRIAPLIARGEIEQAVAICRGARGAAARVLCSTLQSLHRSREQLDDVIAESILHETPHLDRFGAAVVVIAAVAPLLGLLGTVTGMISTFDVITEFGTGDPRLLSGGISQALVTTQLGLIVAIPALIAGSLLSGWAEAIKDELERSALRATNTATNLRQTPGSDRQVGSTKPPGDASEIATLSPGTLGAA